MSAPLKAAWGLTAFVILAGVVGWIVTDRAVFALRPTSDRPARKEGPTS